MSGCCHSVENWSVASQTSQFLLVPDGRLWKPKADHSQSPCRLETAACRLREGRRQEEDQPHAKEKNRKKTQKERQKKVKVLHSCSIHITSHSHIDNINRIKHGRHCKLSSMAAALKPKCLNLKFKTNVVGENVSGTNNLPFESPLY